MGPFGVVVGDPSHDQVAGMGKVMKQHFVQELVPHPAVEALHETVLHRLSRGDVMPFDLVLGTPLQDRVRGQFSAIVRHDHPGLAAAFDQGRQLPAHAATRNRGVRDRRKTLARDVIDYVQHPEAPPAGELVMHEVERPARIGPRLDQDRCP